MTRRSPRRRSYGAAVLLVIATCVANSTAASAAPIAWSLSASPNVGTAANELQSVSCGAPTSCVAVGYAVSSAGIRRTLVESWNGTTWTVQTSPNRGTRNNSLSSVSCPSSTSCVAVGFSLTTTGMLQTLVETWNGTAWAITASPGTNDSELTGVSCTSPTNCVAVGYDANSVGSLQTLIERSDGTTWSVDPSPNPAPADNVLNSVSCTSSTNCVAVGNSIDGIGTLRTLVETFDGSTWTATPSITTTTATFAAVSCTSSASCVAVGSFGTTTQKTLTASWDGISWSKSTSPNRGTRSNLLSAVVCTSSVSCVAVGSNDTTTLSQTLIETWDGTAWSLTASPNRGSITNVVNGVSCATALRCITTGASVSNLVKRTLVLTASAPPDATPPTVSVSTPRDGAYYVVGETVHASYRCADDATGSGVGSCVGTAPDAAPIDTSTVGATSFSVTATDGATNSFMTTKSYTVVDPQNASSDLPSGGGSVTTDPGSGPTSLLPITTTVTSVDEGTLSVDQGAVTLTPPSGFNVLGVQIDIAAPPAAPSAPLTLGFDVDAAMLPGGTTPQQVSLLKDLARVPDCAGATALPVAVTACITSRTTAPSAGGDVRVTAIAESAGQWNIATGSATAPSLSISNAAAPEGDTGTSVLELPVSLSLPSALPVTVGYATSNRVATAGSDYTATSGTLTFPPGVTSAVVPVTVIGNTTAEPDETFNVTLSAPSGATIAHGAGIGSIRDDDARIPGAPPSIRAIPGDTSATVRWAAPGSSGGRTVGGYVVTPFINGVARPSRIFTNRLVEQTITGLTNGTEYTFKVAATNAIGTGPMSTASARVVIGAPLATKVSAVGASTNAALSWSPPANNGRAITAYLVTVYKGTVLQTAKTHTVTCTQPCTPGTTWTVSGLTNGQEYGFRVAASNARGTGPAGTTTILVSATPHAPARPSAPTAKLVSIGIFLSWVAPTNGTATITLYEITPYRNGVAQNPVHIPATVTQFYVLNFTNGVPYKFTIAAVNAAGVGQQSPPSNSVTPIATPT